MVDNAPRRGFEIIDHVFVAHFEHAASRQHVAPMGHQLGIFAIVAPKLAKVATEILLGREQF